MSPGPVNNATGLFIGAVMVVIIWAGALERGRYISKDTLMITIVIITTAGVAMWLLWLCAWMHQWHPLIYPTWKQSEGTTATAQN